MPKSRIQARVDDTRKREVEQFAEENEVTHAEAVRRLVGRGIDYEQGIITAEAEEDEDSDEPLLRIGDALVYVGSLSWLASLFALVPYLALAPPASIIMAAAVTMLTGYGGSLLVGLGATLWVWSAAPDESLLEVARRRFRPIGGVAR